MRKAFLLGAGLGTRLKPLTDTLPKPLIPVENRPLVTHAMDRLIEAGITDIAINTHHLPMTWEAAFPDKKYRNADLTFFYEPILLETGGGIKNIAQWIGSDSFLIYNGDILTDLPIDKLMTGHMMSNNIATLAVRADGPEKRITVDGRKITDIRSEVAGLPGTHQFTGIYCADAEILDLIPPNEKITVIPALQELVRRNEIGAYLVKECRWLDLGNRESYLEAAFQNPGQISPSAKVSSEAAVENSWIGDDATIESGASVKNSIIWPQAHVSGDAELTNCIVHSNSPASGFYHNSDL
ncbi:sugar phosphate nucleotidyltransferase [Akkermansiaceae bacterium]|nr:sugar phosphate nucleotidyltransferase [Akkermansiaceae bacterium]